MKLTSLRQSTAGLMLCLISMTALAAGNRVVIDEPSQFKDAVKALEPGDTLVLANGRWNDFEMLFQGEGTAEAPITLTAETKGEVIISGRSNLRLAGKHLVVSGLVFRDGYTPTEEVISFRRTKGDLAHYSRVTETVIDHFNNPERREKDFWVIMHGTNNRFDHNYLAGKSNNGVTMAVRLDVKESLENRHRIDHNYFGHRPVLGSNGGETLRIGTSTYSLENSSTLVENNYFEHCDGEVEIISNKSGNNVFRGNVFYESRGTLTLRHGSDNVIEDNVFFGNGVDHTGGIRVINAGQRIRNNYLEGLTGHRFGSALTVMNGVPDSPINRYHQVRDAVIENNSVIHSRHVQLAAGSDAERSAVPIDSVIRNNLLVSEGGTDPVEIFDDVSGIHFEGNVADQVREPVLNDGFQRQDVVLERATNGLLYPTDPELSGVGVSRELTVIARDATGPEWYPKPVQVGVFGSGAEHKLKSGDDLAAAVTAAASGDVLLLESGEYLVDRTIELAKAVTLKGVGEQPLILFEGKSLFEIQAGGALRLEALRVSGSRAPDMAGNSLIRTSDSAMLGSYRLEFVDTVVENLDANHSFNVLTVAPGTFAGRVLIENSTFSGITGTVLELDRETDDRGLYNVEYIEIVDSKFLNIGEALAAVYRGGKDESTFGPHFTLRGNVLDDVGNNERGAHEASVFLLGVQDTKIIGNTLRNSAPIRIRLTVGEPRLTMTENDLNDTPEADVVSLVSSK